jgi:hypothetical protein
VSDGIYVWISGRVANDGPLMTLVEENTQLACHQIANVESADRMVRFEYNVLDVCGDALFLWLADAIAAARLVRVLPGRRTKDFHSQLRQSECYDDNVLKSARSCLCDDSVDFQSSDVVLNAADNESRVAGPARWPANPI